MHSCRPPPTALPAGEHFENCSYLTHRAVRPVARPVLFTILGRYKHSRPIGWREWPAVAPYLPARAGCGYAGRPSPCDTLTQSQQVPIHIPNIISDIVHDQNAPKNQIKNLGIMFPGKLGLIYCFSYKFIFTVYKIFKLEGNHKGFRYKVFISATICQLLALFEKYEASALGGVEISPLCPSLIYFPKYSLEGWKCVIQNVNSL